MATKQQILEEIKRTTKENNNKPLGQKSFQKETGIGPYEWTKHWPRFGDALKEAGFKPNKPWTRYPDKLLIQRVVEKIRKHGKYPTINELRVEVNNGDDFPLHIFKKRSQPYIIEKIIEYCQNKKNYKDIIDICTPIIEKFNIEEKSVNNFKTNKELGEVYLYKLGKNYKIGKSNDSVRRGKELKTLTPDIPNLIHTIITDDPYGVEAYWDKRFESKRKNNSEFFDLNPDDIKAFKRWKKIF